MRLGDQGPGSPRKQVSPPHRRPPRRWPRACWLRCPSRWWSITATRSCLLQASAPTTVGQASPHEDPREGVRPGVPPVSSTLGASYHPPRPPRSLLSPNRPGPLILWGPQGGRMNKPRPEETQEQKQRGGGLAVAPTPGPAPGGAGGLTVHLIFMGRGQQAASVTEKPVPPGPVVRLLFASPAPCCPFPAPALRALPQHLSWASVQ